MTMSQLDHILSGYTAHESNLTQQHESLLLDKLQDMVPIMPRDRALSKLEIINYVIDYIGQLREMVVESGQDQMLS